MKGARALAAGVLVLAVVCAVPAVSAAQDTGSAPPDTTTTVPEPSPVPAHPAVPPTTTNPAPQDPKTTGDQGGSQGQAAPQQGGDSPSVTVSSPASADRAHASASTRVTMDDFFFSPASVTISVGDIVTWHNSGHAPHTATADDGSFDTGTVAAGQSASHMFTSPGTFAYVCTIHPNMHGTVRVLAAGGSSGSGGGSGSKAGSSSSSAPTEAQAVASPNAAGNSTTLPMTGMAAGSLALVGLALLAAGVAVKNLGRRRAASGAGPATYEWPTVGTPEAVSSSSTLPVTGMVVSTLMIVGLAVFASRKLSRF